MAAVQLALLGLVLLLWGARGACHHRIRHQVCSTWVAAQLLQQRKAPLVLLVVLAMHGSRSALEKQQPCSSNSSSMLTLLLLSHMLEQLAPQQQQQAMHCSCQALTMLTLSWVQTLGSALAQANTAGRLVQAVHHAWVGQMATETGRSSCTAAAHCCSSSSSSSSKCSSTMCIMHWGQILLLLLGLAAWLAGLQHLVVEVCLLRLTCIRLLLLGAPTPLREWQQCSCTSSSTLGCGNRTIDGAARMLELAGVRIRTQQCQVSIGQVLLLLLLLLPGVVEEGC
jgi:hypothetical protein